MGFFAPIAATVLQVSIHVGEYAQPQAGRALLLLGDTTTLADAGVMGMISGKLAGGSDSGAAAEEEG